MNPTARPRPVAGYQMEELDGEILLFHPASARILHSNSSGLLIWKLCDGQRSVADICRLLSAAYPESAGQIEADVCQALRAFRDYGALTFE